MICGNCGAHLADNAEYCPRCGTVFQPVPAPQTPTRTAPGGAPPRTVAAVSRPVSMGKYFLWWTVALFSNAELVCCVLSFVFAFSSNNRNRANFFRAVLLFKLIVLLAGVAAVIVLVLCGFSFTALLNSFDFSLLENLIDSIM